VYAATADTMKFENIEIGRKYTLSFTAVEIDMGAFGLPPLLLKEINGKSFRVIKKQDDGYTKCVAFDIEHHTNGGMPWWFAPHMIKCPFENITEVNID
jgi:hypothetical protein